MSNDNFWYFNEHDINTMVSCHKDEADYVTIELYDKLLKEHERVLQENLVLMSIIEYSGVDVDKVLEAKRNG